MDMDWTCSTRDHYLMLPLCLARGPALLIDSREEAAGPEYGAEYGPRKGTTKRRYGPGLHKGPTRPASLGGGLWPGRQSSGPVQASSKWDMTHLRINSRGSGCIHAVGGKAP